MGLGDPNDLEVEEAKVRDYLLNPSHPQNRGKCGFFLLLGFSRVSWQDLANALRAQGVTGEVVGDVANAYGRKNLVEGPMKTPSGRQTRVRTIWFIGEEYPRPRLVTADPVLEREPRDDP